ncbi:DUF3861 domain-containing protein [Sodalis sp. RH22]|uniref:DUF3861 domain-containing protein n=1 Tax=unclassified Sodalis (in: enterobacteria) TaxID=2636512 RepID=UPI0039B4890E
MAGYKYKITVAPIADKHGQPLDMPALSFEVENHDEILGIVTRLQGREDLAFGPEKTASFAIGLKLFSEVMMEYRKHPLFAPLREPFRDFMQLLKKGPGAAG